MLMIGDRLNSYTIAAGEPWIMSVQMRANAGNAIIDWSQRRLVLSFYTAGRALKEQIEGVYTSDASGAYFAFIRDGSFSESLFGESLQVELAERLLNGRAIIATGPLSVVPSSQGVTTFGSVIGRADARFTIYFTDASLISLIEQEILPYNVPVVTPPVTLGILSLSGTLRVGTASNGTISGATNGSTITENISGFTVNSGVRTYAYDGTGSTATIADGLTETHPNATNSPRQSAVTVAAALVTLSALSLAANSVTENAASGTVIGGILGKTTGSTLSLANDDGGRFAISGTNLVAGLTSTDYEAGTSRSIVLRETLAGATNSPRDTPLAVGVINVNEQPSLRALLLSSTSLTIGTPASGAITEAATGSTITASGLPAGFTINGPARTWAYDGSGPASTPTITLTETLGDSPNSPRATQIGLTIAAATPQPIVITPASAAFADSFAGDGALNTRPNWLVPSGQEGRWATSAGSLKYNQLYGPNSRVIFGGDVGDQEFVFEYNTSGDQEAGWENERQGYYLWYKDDSNNIAFSFSKGVGVVSVAGVVNGTSGQVMSFARPAEQANRDRGTLTFKLADGMLRVAFEGVWSRRLGGRFNYPFDRADLAGYGVPAGLRSGKFSLTANTWRYPRTDGIAVYASQIALLTDDEFVGRDSVTATGGTWTGTGSYSGNPSQWAARVLDFKTGAVVADWSAPKSITAANGAFTATVFLPTGGPYTVEIAWIGADGFARIARSRPVLSGYHVVYYGQSNSIYRAAILDGAVRGDRYASFVPAAANQDNAFPAGHWASTLTDFRPSASIGLARTTAPLLNVPVAITATGVAATPIGYLSPGGEGWNTFLQQVSTLKGIIELVIWDQGEGDADGAQATADYVAKFRDVLLPGLRDRAGNPNMKVLIAPFGNYPDAPPGGAGSQAKFNSQRETIRQAYKTLVDTVAGVSFASFKLGANHAGDPYHYTNTAYYDTLGTRDGLSVAKALGASTYDGRGPQVTGATRAGAAITLAIGLNGATSIEGPVAYNTYSGTRVAPPVNSFKGYEVSADDFATNLPISDIAVTGGNLVITLASAPSGPVKVRSMAGANYDDTSLFVGQYDGGLTIPVAPIIKYLTA